MTYPLIGLMGRRGAGKDTAGQILVDQFGYVRQAYADAVKREMYEAFGEAILVCRSMMDAFEKGWTTTPEQSSLAAWLAFFDAHKNDPATSEFGWLGPAAQFWGSDLRRERCDPDYWLRQLDDKLGPRVVVTDVRFPNEAQHIRDHGGLVVRVERPGVQDDGAARGSSHPSESLVDTITPDRTLLNDETLADLATRVRSLMLPFAEWVW